MGTRASDLLLLLGSAAFCAVGLAMALWSERPAAGVLIAGLFGLGVAVAVWKLRYAERTVSDLAESLDVPGLAREPLRFQEWKPVAGGFLVSAIGIGFALARVNELWWWLGIGLVVAGIGILCAVALGFKRKSISFTRDGLAFEDRNARFVIPWDGFVVDLGEVQGIPAVFLRVVDHEATRKSVQAVGGGLDAARSSVDRKIASPIMVFPNQYGTEAAIFLQAVETYVGDPERRAELRVMERLAEGD